jgi:diguanylate cyclase (GGDEF)-like protein/PAS domain S-box-containing protein
MNPPEHESGEGATASTLVPKGAARLTRGARHLFRHNAVVFVFAILVTVQLGVATVSIYALSAVRAYVTAESLYSKGQKDALLNLQAYLRSHDDGDYQRFLADIAVPEGDHRARLAMQQARPDFDAARQGFFAAKNHPSDIGSMIWLFHWGQHVPFMARAIAVWTEADASVEALRLLVTRARMQIMAGQFESPEEMAMRTQAPAINQRLTMLESAFSDELGRAARALQVLLLVVNVTVAVLLIAAGGTYMCRSTRIQRQNETDIRHLVDAVGDAILACNERHQLVIFNRAAERMFGCDARQAKGQPISRFLQGAFEDILVPSGPPRSDDTARRLQAVRFDGAGILLEASVSHITTFAGVLTIVTCRDVTEREAAQERERQALSRLNLELVHKVHTDALTGLPNRAALELALERLFATTLRDSALQFAVLFLDLDGFKAVNDSLGHMAGDELLQHVAYRLKGATRAGDEVFRVSGDEFVVVASCDDDPHVGEALSKRILAAVRDVYVLDGDKLARVTVSVGVANFPADGPDARALIMAADAAMYRAKQSGKNNYRVGVPP